MNLDKREYCSYTSNIFKNTLYPVLPLTSSTWKIIFPQTLTSEISPGNPACMVLLMTLPPLSSLPHFFVCLFVHLSHYVVSLGLTSFIFILSSHYTDSASSRKAEAWCPQLSLFLDSKKTRERQKKLQTNIFHPIYSQIYFQDVFPYAGLKNVLSFDHSRRGKAVCLYLT